MRVLIQKPLCFEIENDVLEKHDRLDAHFLHPRYLELEKRLEKSPYELRALTEISDAITCGSTPRDYDPFAQEGVLFLKTVNVQDGMINLEEKHYISVDSHSRRKFSEVRKNDLLMTIIGANEKVVGRVALVREDIIANINQNIAKIRVKEGVSPKYLEAFLSTGVGRNLILRISRTATRVNMNLKEVESIRIPIPPLEIQQRVVKITEDAKTKRRQNLEEVEMLKKELDDLFEKELGLSYPDEKKETIFVDDLEDRFDPYYYHPRFKRILEILEKGRFGSKKLAVVVGFSREQIDVKKEPNRLFKYIQIQNIDEEDHKIASYTPVLGKDAPGRARMLIKEGDILLPILGGSIKSVAIVPKEFDGEVASNGFAIVRIADERLRYFVFYYLISKFAQIQIQRNLTGAIMSSVSKSELENILIPLPDKRVQERIAEKIRGVHSKVSRLRDEAEKILKDAKYRIEQIILGE